MKGRRGKTHSKEEEERRKEGEESEGEFLCQQSQKRERKEEGVN